MSLRLIEVVIPRKRADDIKTFFSSETVIDIWREEIYRDTVVFHILVPAEASQTIIDRLARKFRKEERFRIVILGVEGTLPAVEEAPPPAHKRKITRIKVSREELYDAINDAADFNYLFAGMVFLSTLIASFGFVQNNVPVIIGAMVIAPLLGPNIALALGTVLGDITLEKKALLSNLYGILIVLAVSVVFGALFTVDPHSEALTMRAHVNYSDLAIALASGIAGVLSFTTGAAASLIGVMVAISLLPPLVAAGMFLGAAHPFHALARIIHESPR